MTQWTKDKQPQNLFRVTEMGISVDEAGKVSLKLWIDINCYFGNRSGNVDFSAPTATAVRIWICAATIP